ncbi:U2AF4-like protein [Mya arenaria]|uniref:U2AF4-like protein n=1 Tax=Mya arenaria TaxID=6604 RepID=A0ABY7E8W8_MYAAR|nr:U2AF4-like protein [Mya arenaria]
MAEYLASIFGTEKDKVNCSFYFKIGACRHGERCSRLHNKPTFSQTVLLQNLYLNPQNAALTADGSHITMDEVEAQQTFDNFFEEVFCELEDKKFRKNLSSPLVFLEGCFCKEIQMDEMEIQQHYDEFFEEIYVEMEKYGEIEEMNKAVNDLNNRWFNGRPIHSELSPVTDFREACCRQYEMGECTRGGFCNFMHLKPISRELRRELYGRSRKTKRRSRSPPTRRSRSRSRDKKRSRSRERRRSRSRDRRGRF